MTPDHIETIPIDGTYDLRASLALVSVPWGRFRSDGWWRPAQTPDGAVTLHIVRTTTGVEARLWGPGWTWLSPRITHWLGLHDRPQDFSPQHPVVAEEHRRNLGMRFGQTELVFEALIKAIVAQKVVGKDAVKSLRALAVKFGEPAPGPHPELHTPPTADRLAHAPYYLFHPLGVERRRADIVRRMAAVGDKVDRLTTTDSVSARTWLERFRGVGVWTSAETVTISHGDTDAVPVGDFHLKNVVAWHLHQQPRGTDEQMLASLEQFRPHRGRVLRLLERKGSAPKYGPRMPLADFADH